MNKIKCGSCGLVDFAGEGGCRRCGVSLYETSPSVSKSRGNAPRRTIPLVPIAIAAAAAFGLYSYLGAEPAEPVNANVATHTSSQLQPRPTLSLRAEHEQRMTGSYQNAIKTSPGLAESQKHVDETQKLMQNEPAKAR